MRKCGLDMQERLVCAAIHFDDGNQYAHQPTNIGRGIVVTGLRHCNCYVTAYEICVSLHLHESVSGFLTSHNRFVDRKEAFTIATNADQVLNPEEIVKGEMYSENLY